MKYLIILSIFLSGFYVDAQNLQSFINFGINGSQIDGDGLGGYYQPGIYGGMGLTLPIKKKLDSSFEIAYSGEGSRTNQKQEDQLGRINYRMHYLDFSGLINYYITEKFAVSGGLELGYLLYARFKSFNEERVLNQQFRKIDLAYDFGVKYQLSEKWWFQIRHSRSIITPSKNGSAFYNNNLRLSVNLSL